MLNPLSTGFYIRATLALNELNNNKCLTFLDVSSKNIYDKHPCSGDIDGKIILQSDILKLHLFQA